ncbi:MAG: hypothetical protein FWD15_05190 [Alphaproteobacteria bacterium]|nr:hypothetical protein [Alphaproteobacteria bacterium]
MEPDKVILQAILELAAMLRNMPVSLLAIKEGKGAKNMKHPRDYPSDWEQIVIIIGRHA